MGTQTSLTEQSKYNLKEKMRQNITFITQYKYKKVYRFNANKMFYIKLHLLKNEHYLQKQFIQSYQQLKTIQQEIKNYAEFIRGENTQFVSQNFMRKKPTLLYKYRQIINKIIHRKYKQTQTQEKQTHKIKQKMRLSPNNNEPKIIQPIKSQQIKEKGFLKRWVETIEKFKNFFDSIQQKEQWIFKLILKNSCQKMRHVVYLPTITKVILADVNSIDLQKKQAVLSLRVEIKVQVPGYSKDPQFYQEFFKRNMKVEMKTQNHSIRYKRSISFKQKQKTKYFDNVKKFFYDILKWRNYNIQIKGQDQRQIDQFQGFIFTFDVQQYRAAIKMYDKFSPFQLIDLQGIVQISPIKTKIQDWFNFLVGEQFEYQMKQFMEQASPEVQIKFSQISLYVDKELLRPTNKILFNHIYSFDPEQHNRFYLASNLMFFQVSNVRLAKYYLDYSFLKPGYNWVEQQKRKFKSLTDRIQILQYRYKQRLQTRNQFQFKNMPMQNQQITSKIQKIIQQLHQLQKSDVIDIQRLNNFCKNVKTKIQQESMDIYDKKLKQILKQSGDRLMSTDNMQQIDQFEQKLNTEYDRLCDLSQLVEQTQDQLFKIQLKLEQILSYSYLKQYEVEIKMTISTVQLFRVDLHMIYSKLINYKGQNRLILKNNYKLYLKYLNSRIAFYQINKNDYYLRYLQLNQLQKNPLKQRSDDNIQFLKKQKKRIQIRLQRTHKYLEQLFSSFRQFPKVKSKHNLKQTHYDDQFNKGKAAFHFPMYRNPLQSLLLIFGPVLILGLINIFILFQNLLLSQRIANVTALMISFTGMIQIINTQLTTERITIFHILFYLQMFVPLLCFFKDVINIFNQNNLKQFVSQDGLNIIPFYLNSVLFYCLLFLSSLVTLLNLVVPILFYLKFKYFDEPVYKINLSFLKKFQPMYLMLPGSKQVDKRLQICSQNRDLLTDNLKRNQLHNVIISMILDHLLQAIQIQKKLGNILDQNQLNKNLQTVKKQLLFQYPFFRQKILCESFSKTF